MTGVQTCALPIFNTEEPWIGFEQEYALLKGKLPLGFPEDGFPAPQGPYYCGVGAGAAFGRPAVEAHTRACLNAGLMIYGINAEVLPGQWEFQIGYRGIAVESADPLTVSDHLWLARWLLYRIGEDFGISPSAIRSQVLKPFSARLIAWRENIASTFGSTATGWRSA